MKKVIVSMVIFLGMGFAGSPLENQEFEVVSIYDIKQEDFCESPKDCPSDVVVKIPEGGELPLYVSIDGDLVSINQEKNANIQIRFNQTVYVRIVNEEMFLSCDLQEWRSFYEYFTGQINFTSNIMEGDTSFILSGKINRKD